MAFHHAVTADGGAGCEHVRSVEEIVCTGAVLPQVFEERLRSSFAHHYLAFVRVSNRIVSSHCFRCAFLIYYRGSDLHVSFTEARNFLGLLCTVLNRTKTSKATKDTGELLAKSPSARM